MENSLVSSPQTRKSPFNVAALLSELLIILIAAVFATANYADFDPRKRLGGIEAEYLTRTAYSFSTLLQQKGYIPVWDPYMELGDPSLGNPVSFAYNPFLILPSVLFGPYNGIKISIILTAILAGLGGWLLARVLGLGALARLLLALLCIGKGNMPAFLSQGHWAFFASQAYFPWIFAGVIGIMQGYRRWPLILTATAFSLVFFAGSPWYPPAIGFAMIVLALVYGVDLVARTSNTRVWQRIRIKVARIGLVLFSFVLTMALGAVTIIPLWNNRDRIGGSLITQDFRADLSVVLSQFFSGVKEFSNPVKFPEGNSYAFYSYVSPLWFLALLGALALVIIATRRKLVAFAWRPLIASLFIFIFCMLWGAGQNPIIEWSYRVIPLASQFRHVERVLAMASLALIVFIALIVDGLWYSLVSSSLWRGPRWLPRLVPKAAPRLIVTAGLILSCAVSSYQVLDKWHGSWGDFFVVQEDDWENYCITWLRRQYPDRELAVGTLNYMNTYTYYRNQVRHSWVNSDFYHAQPVPSTVFSGNMVSVSGGPTELMPEFAIGFPHFDEKWMQQHGYQPIPESANPYQNNKPCMYRRDGAFSYAYWVTRDALNAYVGTFPVTITHPITDFLRNYDRIALTAQASSTADVIVAVQELAYQGWNVQIDGVASRIESVGGLVGVVLPRDGLKHTVIFQYLSSTFYLQRAITLLSAILFILYLLRADRLLPQNLPRRLVTQLADAWDLRDVEP